jgi:hypothetical protein
LALISSAFKFSTSLTSFSLWLESSFTSVAISA